jgi:DNA-binding LytR/AlgR family response regulator
MQSQSNMTLLNYLTNKVIHLDTVKPGFRRKRERVVVRQGVDNISLPLSQIVFFYTENKLVYAFDCIGKKYVAEINLASLEHELDESIFFRANRQYIINIDYIKSFRNYEKVKLIVRMEPNELNEKYCIIVSQEKAPIFKRWIYAA